MPVGTTLIQPDIWCNGIVVGNEYWVDGVQLEEGRVASTWTPGALGLAAVLDRAGVQIDAKEGGIFRLRGSTGGVRDLVELGPGGLVIGGDTDLTSPSLGALSVEGVPVSLSGHTHAYEPSGTVATHAAAADPHTGYLQESAIRRDRTTNQASLAGGANADYSMTWKNQAGVATPFPDTNYTAQVTLWTDGVPAGRQLSFTITAITAAGMTLRIHNNTAGTAINPGWHAIGIHD